MLGLELMTFPGGAIATNHYTSEFFFAKIKKEKIVKFKNLLFYSYSLILNSLIDDFPSFFIIKQINVTNHADFIVLDCTRE